VNAAPATRARSVEVVAGLDESQVCAAWELHQEWAREDGQTLDPAIWTDHMRGLVTSGKYNLWVAWDGPHAVGVAEMFTCFDPRSGDMVGQGERTYILPAYRNARVFKAMYESGLEAMKWLGIRRQRAVVAMDETGRFLQRFHEAHGLRPIEMVMERVIDENGEVL